MHLVSDSSGESILMCIIIIIDYMFACVRSQLNINDSLRRRMYHGDMNER